MKEKVEMPLLRALLRYSIKRPVRFHMPGHKGGRGFSKDFKKLFKNNLFKWDVTEIPGLDDLHEPEGVLKKAQERLSRLYGADMSFFLVNGSTSGVLAMMGAALNPEDKVIVSRASHRSVLSGLILTGAEPVYVVPEWHEELGVYTQITPKALKKVLEKTPKAKAIVVTNPTYQGFCTDLKQICDMAHKKGLLILVDEAQGPHFAFSSFLPASAGDLDVDAWVQSPHKMLSSMTQSAWLHVKGPRIDKDRIYSYLDMVTSTSPSYILMASLDYTRAMMESCGQRLLKRAFNMARQARSLINSKSDFWCIGDELKGRKGIFDIDLSRLMVNVSRAGYTGFQVEKLMRRKFNIYAEYADLCNVYFLVTFGNNSQDVKRLVQAFIYLSGRKGRPIKNDKLADKESISLSQLLKEYSAQMKKLPQKAMEPREAFLAEGEWIPLKFSSGRIIKRALIPYPPGVPLLLPGEIIEREYIDLIEGLLKSGCRMEGLKGRSICAAV